MIPKLYAPDGTTFLAALADATVCEVTEERNGIYELYLEIPTASAQFPLVENDCFVKAKSSDVGDDQLFRVYSVEKSMRGVPALCWARITPRRPTMSSARTGPA